MASGGHHADQVSAWGGRCVRSTRAPTVIGLSVCSSGGRAESQLWQLTLLVRGARCQARLLSCGGGGVADGQPDGPVAEISDEVQSASEGFDVAGDDLEGGDFAVLDLGYPGDAHAHGGGDLLLAQAQLLAGLGELMPAGLGEQPARARGDFLGGDPGGVQFALQVLPVQGVRLGMAGYSSACG
jgi:hypothetical protein